SFVLTKDEMQCLDTARVMTGINIKYLMALLNSKFCEWVFAKFYAGGNLQGDTVRYKSTFLENLPIPELSAADQVPYEILVDCIQFARERGLDAEADTLEAVVDVMVYGLYFMEDMKAADCYINERIAESVRPFTDACDDAFKAAYVKKLAEFCKKDAVVYRGLIQSRNVGVVKTISGGKGV
ncbi:MAG TPA: hypothetical protein DCG47_02185, partial [Spirochaetaceae bacterium]|nr:hypothetical protein [Spirochaetaceae bacterium]